MSFPRRSRRTSTRCCPGYSGARSRPPGWFLTRRTSEATQLDGVPLPAGTLPAYSPYLTHRMPQYFPEPHRFDPDRWKAADGTDSRTSPSSAFIPFGAGRRTCIGDLSGITEAAIALAAVAARWRLRHAPGTQPRTDVRFIIAPKDLLMRPVRRGRPV